MEVGIQNNGTINGYTILDISDAKGLESKVKEDDFKNQFIGKNVSAFVLSDEPHNDAEIEAPNGARDASGTVVNGINTAIITLEFIDESMGGLLE
jgi:electron transport complex protein RnfG